MDILATGEQDFAPNPGHNCLGACFCWGLSHQCFVGKRVDQQQRDQAEVIERVFGQKVGFSYVEGPRS